MQTAAPSAPTTPPTGDLSTQREAGASLTATAAPTTGPLSWVAVIGPPYQQQVLADAFLAEVRASVPTAQRMPVTQLLQIGFVNGVVVVLPGFSTREQVTQFCTAVPPGLPPGCQPVATVAG